MKQFLLALCFLSSLTSCKCQKEKESDAAPTSDVSTLTPAVMRLTPEQISKQIKQAIDLDISWTDQDGRFHDLLVEAASAGTMEGAGTFEGLNEAVFEDIAGAASQGVMTGVGEIEGFDLSLFEDLAQASSAGSVEGAGQIKNIDLAALEAIGEAAAAGSLQGLKENNVVDQTILDGIIVASADGAKGIDGIDSEALQDSIVNSSADISAEAEENYQASIDEIANPPQSMADSN